MIVFLGGQSCEKTYDSFLGEKVQTYFSDEMKELEAIIILPNQGCGGCISEVEYFLIYDSKKYNHVKFILTNIYSKKILYQKLGDSICHASNVYLDLDNHFVKTTFKEAQYPAILYVEEEKIEKIEYQNPNNPAAIIQLTKWLSR